MRYFEVDTCYLKDHDLCFIEKAPYKIMARSYLLSKGRTAKEYYPADQADAVVEMDKDYGFGLGCFIPNTGSFFIASSPIKSAVEMLGKSDEGIEFFPVSIRDHKGRIASSDYWFINPIGQLDCLDQKKSVIRRTDDGDVLGITKMVIDAKKVDRRKAIFRPKEDPYRYIIRHDLLMAIKDLNLPIPNIYVDELEVTGDAP